MGCMKDIDIKYQTDRSISMFLYKCIEVVDLGVHGAFQSPNGEKRRSGLELSRQRLQSTIVNLRIVPVHHSRSFLWSSFYPGFHSASSIHIDSPG